MGSALLQGWLATDASFHVTVIDPAPQASLRKMVKKPHLLLADSTDIASDNEPFDAVILAIKPQLFGAVVPGLKRFIQQGALCLSIAAGKNIASIKAMLGDDTAIVRSMPNTPALIGQGITGMVANAKVSDAQRDLATCLLSSVGDVIWLDLEEHMHAVTAVSGSGPAYVFALIETMQKAGEALGLAPDIALHLARKTVQGAGALAQEKADTLDPAQLRYQVTSPAGTTAAALDVLLAEDGLGKLMRDTLRAAAKRSQELA